MGLLQITAALKEGYTRRPVRLIINLILLIFLVIFLSSRVSDDWEAVLEGGLAIDLRALAVASMLYGGNYLLFIVAWYRLVLWSGGPHGFRLNALHYSYSYLARLLPTPLWHHASRIHLYGEAGMQKRSALAMTVLETLLQILTGAFFYFVVTIQSQALVTVLLAIVVASALAVGVRKVCGKVRVLEAFWEAIRGLKAQHVVVLSVVYLVTWALAGPFLHFVLAAFDSATPPNMLELWRIWTLSSLVAYIGAYTLGGIGILREATLTWLLTAWYPSTTALLVTVASRILLTASGVFWPLLTVGISRLSLSAQHSVLGPPADPAATSGRK